MPFWPLCCVSEGTGLDCSYVNIFIPVTEISVAKSETSVTGPFRLLIWTHRNFYKGKSDEARSWKTSFHEEALSLNYIVFFARLVQRKKNLHIILWTFSSGEGTLSRANWHHCDFERTVCLSGETAGLIRVLTGHLSSGSGIKTPMNLTKRSAFEDWTKKQESNASKIQVEMPTKTKAWVR